MELIKIESLVHKYEEGRTTLEEERSLRDFFASGNVPDHLKSYKAIFVYTTKAKIESYPKEVDVNGFKHSRTKKFAWVGIAAGIILAAGIFTTLNFGNEKLNVQQLGTIEDPEEAYLKAKETLQLVSQVLNTGQNELTYVIEFDKAKDKYIK